MNGEEMAHELAQACANMREMLEPVEEAARGYRKWLEDQGWSNDTAETMALEYYRKVMKFI